MRYLFVVALGLAACSGPAPDTDATNTMTSAGAADRSVSQPSVAPPGPGSADASAEPAMMSPADYLGRWTGVEGMFLNVTKAGEGVQLEMQYDLDHKVTVPGKVTAEGLRFDRDGKMLLARPSNGDATGLKWLAGKKDCLTVASGEGYCRD